MKIIIKFNFITLEDVDIFTDEVMASLDETLNPQCAYLTSEEFFTFVKAIDYENRLKLVKKVVDISISRIGESKCA